MAPRKSPTAGERGSFDILLVTNGLNIGGIETNLVLLAEEFVARGHRVRVASGGGVLEERLVAIGVQHFRLRMRLDRPRDVLADARTLRRILRRSPPSIVHTFSASASALVRLARLGLPRAPPTVSSVMGLQNSPDEPTWRIRLRAWVTTWGARRVLVIAPAIGRVLATLPVRQARLLECLVVGVRPPTPEEIQRPGKEIREALAPGANSIVMTIGRLDPSKSHHLFVEAAGRLRDVPGVRFIIIGGGALEPALRAQIGRLGLEGRVVLHGERKDAPSLLRAADVYVRPGVVEGFVGITVLEAQMRGIPVVSFETEDVRLAITDGESGILVPRGDVDALADAIRRLIEDRDLAHAVATAGRQKANERFSISAVAEGLLQVYSAHAAAAPGA